MKKIKMMNNWFVGLALTLLAVLTGAAGSVAMAAAGSIPADEGGGVTNNGEGSAAVPAAVEGVATETFGRANADADFYLNDIDKKIVKIRPFSTPVDQISRYATNRSVDSFIVKYYSVGTRPITATVTTALAATTDANKGTTSYTLEVDDPTIFTMDDTIRVVGVKAAYDNVKHTEIVTATSKTADLVLVVIGRSDSGYPLVCPMNGKYSSTTSQATMIPTAIAKGTTLVRMGKACGETDIQTGRFANIPQPDVQYCQNFAMQVEQSTFDKIAAKEVDWDFSDLEEDALYDMRLTQELSYLFGDQGYMTHTKKEGMAQWFTKGIWWQAGRDLPIGHKVIDTAADADSGVEEVAHNEISDDDLIELAHDIFVGAGTGNKRKVILCGSDVLENFGKIKSDKYRMVSTFERWHLKFTEWETGFGSLYLIHDELFDQCGMSKQAFCLDPEFLYKATHVSHARNVLDLKSAGIRNTDAVVLREVSALYLRYPNAHARLHLAYEG